MEKELDKVLEETMEGPGVQGVLIADHQGLCMGARGTIDGSTSGIMVALAEHACRLQPHLKPPVLTLSNGSSQYVIQRQGTITAAVFKQTK